MKVTETMIEAFFRDELNEYQKELVKEYFRQYPEALQKYLTEKSWEDFTPTEALGLPVADKMFRIIESGTYGRNKIRRIYYQCAAVAAVLFIVGFGYHLLTKKASAGNLVPAPRENSLAEARPEWKQEINSTGKTMKLSLKDGSLVELSSGSELRYREPFAPDKRDLYLTGQALFNVGKDKIRPFTVYAGGLHITALGTVFRVVSLKEEGRKTEVHLLSGKVVVRPDSLLEKRGIKEIYLDQGQLLLLDKLKFTMAISRPGGANGADPKKPAIPALKKILTFNNESLEDIFKEIGAGYGVTFVYEQAILKDMSFTGKYNNQKETLENFLSTIATLNNLTITQKKNTIYISQ